VLTLGSHLIVNVNTNNYVYLGSTGSNHVGDGIVNQGTINLQGSTLNIDPYNFTNQGTINAFVGTLNITAGTFLNSGALIANGGNIAVSTTETTGGTATIYGTSQIEYSASSYDNVTFALGSTGELLLLNSGSFHGTVTGFTGSGTGAPATSDKIDLRDINFLSASQSYTNNILTVTDGSHTANIKMVGSYTLTNFHFANDGSGGTLVTDPPAGPDQSGALGTATAAPTVKVSLPDTSDTPISSSSANSAPYSTGSSAVDAHLGNKQIAHSHTSPDVVGTLAAAEPVVGGAALNMNRTSGQTETSREPTGLHTLDHLTGLVEQISKLATTGSGMAHSGATTPEAIHQASSALSQFFDLSMGRGANFKFNELSSTDLYGKLLTDPALVAQQDGSRAASISGDQFAFKAYLGSSDHGTISKFGPVQSKTDFDYAALSANDGLNAGLSSDATVGGENSGNHPSQDLMLSKNIILAPLHASDFILPSH
jgi:hypothetical protein